MDDTLVFAFAFGLDTPLCASESKTFTDNTVTFPIFHSYIVKSSSYMSSLSVAR